MIAPRWRVLAALFVVTATVSSSVAAFGVFLPVLGGTLGAIALSWWVWRARRPQRILR